MSILFRLQVENHAKENHTQKEKWECLKCLFKSVTYTSLYIHYKRQHLPGNFICNYSYSNNFKCGFTGNNRAEVDDHYDKDHSDMTIKFADNASSNGN